MAIAPDLQQPACGDEAGLRTLAWEALVDLEELYRTVLVLRYYQGLTDQEMAEALGKANP